MELTKGQRQQLREAIMSAYGSKGALKMMLLEEMNERLEFFAGGANYGETVFEVINWAEEQGRLEELLRAAYQRNPGNLQFRRFIESYGIFPAFESGQATMPVGPDFTWRGPTTDRELEGFLQPKPDLWDVAFLKWGLAHASSVCRIERSGVGPIGTGFLLQNDLILTNYHVLAPTIDSGLTDYVNEIVVSFGRLTAEDGSETVGQTFKLAEQPIIRSSPVAALDFVVLRTECKILQSQGILAVGYTLDKLKKQDSISIFQHPAGETMKLALSRNGVTYIDEQRGLVQYISRTSSGSSGSPCFNSDWNVVALHHAQKATTFGVVCEGILFSAIYQQISDIL
ncbi:MAG: trypsin-like peptidase domain-containing protein [Leptolyngbyaceae cyanobacterium RM1_406_9]|nr:trypsin-like peptidase domain-containing protein [Leptolyngbyaceae cyanobacterium RM1_406_9]